MTSIRFSLRALMLAVTGFAIGFPIWYRWPYEEVEVLPSPVTSTPTIEKRRITTWQRQWGGGKQKQGPERDLLGGHTLSITTYRHGRKHGPYVGYTLHAKFNGPAMHFVRSDEPTTIGQYSDDLKEGVWTRGRSIETWHRGRLDGPAEIEFASGKKVALHFADGRLTRFNGNPAVNRLYDLRREDGVMDVRTVLELDKSTSIEAVETPLSDLATIISDQHNALGIILETEKLPDIHLPISTSIQGVDLCSALTVITAAHNLGCDYRYGCIWITTAEDAKDWHDPTGVADVRPATGGAIARAWNEPSAAEVVNQPLATVLAKVAQPLAIEIDCTQIAPTADNPDAFPVLMNAYGLPFRHVLGLLLWKTGCRCKLAGDRLVILPPEE